MYDIAAISVHNAYEGLYLTPDVRFYGIECIPRMLKKPAIALHNTQVTTHSYARFADLVTDLYRTQKGGLIDQMAVCAALAMTYEGLSEWIQSAIQVAINIHLNTIGVEDQSLYPRIVPHQLAAMRITDPSQIDEALLWHILVAEPWITYAERSRAQLTRMAKVFGSNGEIDTLPEEIRLLQGYQSDQPTEDNTWEAAKRSIKRGYKLHARLFGPDNLRQLLTKKSLNLSGRLYDYLLTIGANDLINYTLSRDSCTSPIHIKLFRKDGALLCSLCLYFEDVPFIDNLVAITCHLKNSETELELLDAAQVQTATREFYNDPILSDLKGIHDPTMAPMSFIENVGLNANNDVAPNVALRVSFTNFQWSGLARDLIGYPEELIDIFWYGRNYHMWDLIEYTPEGAVVMDRAKAFFRSRFANTD